jgi:hypothetical protein
MESTAASPDRIALPGKNPRYLLDVRLGGPERCGKQKFFLYGESNLDSSVRSLVVIPSEVFRFHQNVVWVCVPYNWSLLVLLL